MGSFFPLLAGLLFAVSAHAADVETIPQVACRVAPAQIKARLDLSQKKLGDFSSSQCPTLQHLNSTEQTDFAQIQQGLGDFTWAEYFKLDRSYASCFAKKDTLCKEMGSVREKQFKAAIARMGRQTRERYTAAMAACVFDFPEIADLRVSFVTQDSLRYELNCGEGCSAALVYYDGIPIRLIPNLPKSLNLMSNIHCCKRGPVKTSSDRSPPGCHDEALSPADAGTVHDAR